MANVLSVTCCSQVTSEKAIGYIDIFSGFEYVYGSECFDTMNELYQHGFFIQYLRKACRSSSPDLLIPLSVLFLNIAVMGHFSPFNVFIAKQYPRLLLTSLRLKNKPLLRNVLFGMGTVIYNDHAALMALVDCPPILTILSEAEKFDPEYDYYAAFCSSCIEEERNNAAEKKKEEEIQEEKKRDDDDDDEKMEEKKKDVEVTVEKEEKDGKNVDEKVKSHDDDMK